MKDLEKHSQEVLNSLREAVAEALDQKRRLGQYAVIAENGQPRRVPADQLELLIPTPKVK